MTKSRKLVMAALAGVAAVVATAMPGAELLSAHLQGMKALGELKVDYALVEVAGTTDEYSVALKKPNLARIESPTETVVMDGEFITRFEKANNRYYKVEQTEEAVKELFKDPALSVWTGFFHEKAFEGWVSSDEGTRTRQGVDLRILELVEPKEQGTTLTLFLDPANMAPKQATIDYTRDREQVTKVLNLTEFNATADASLFAFVAPDGAEEYDPNAVNSEWILDDLEEAKKLAKASGKPIILNFHATWCGPCKAMKAAVFDSDDFAGEATDFVLARVDIDIRPDIASDYRISAVPTTVFLNSDGKEMFREVGGMSQSQFFALMDRARNF